MSSITPTDPEHERPRTPASPSLLPPKLAVEDPGAHDLHSSDEDDHFSDATEGQGGGNTSPIPITRIEKVDSEPSHGEVPGTDAYKIRSQDAVPDEVEVTSRGRTDSTAGLPMDTPGGEPIPKTVVERVDPPATKHGEVPGTDAWEKRKADAVPDRVVKVPDVADPKIPPIENADSNGLPTSRSDRSISQSSTIRRKTSSEGDDERISPDQASKESHVDRYDEDEDGDEQDGGFGGDGDDFDDFEEGAANNDDDDFGDFDDAGFDDGRAKQTREATSPSIPTPQSLPSLSLPVPDFSSLSSPSEIHSAIDAYMDLLFPSHIPSSDPHTKEPESDSLFLTERSASLYTQLLTPPPLSPPAWLRSRIRRLFLVSLGVPIDLDEILPASKQKKLVLPSTLASSRSRSSSPASHASKGPGRRSTSKNPSSSKSDSRRRKGPPPAPKLDMFHARSLCEGGAKGLDGLGVADLKARAVEVDGLVKRAGEVLEYWVGRREGALREKEAFEGVIENLVMHARKVRK